MTVIAVYNMAARISLHRHRLLKYQSWGIAGIYLNRSGGVEYCPSIVTRRIPYKKNIGAVASKWSGQEVGVVMIT